MAIAKVWKPETAVDALIALYDRYKDRPSGERLTMEIIRRLVGVQNVPTVSRWFSKRNAPHGDNLESLGKFLDKSEDPEWLKKTIAKETEKIKRTKGK